MITIKEFDEIVIRWGFIYSHALQDAGGIKIAYFYKTIHGKTDTIVELQYAVESGVTILKHYPGAMLINTTNFDLLDFIQDVRIK